MDINHLFPSRKEKLLFLKYAVPCGIVLVRRGDITRDYHSSLIEKVMSGNIEDMDIENNFKIGSRMCFLIMKKLGKDRIDTEVIRHYFWLEHRNENRISGHSLKTHPNLTPVNRMAKRTVQFAFYVLQANA